ncbi:MAG TPA: serine hydrolase domain-containing protein [Steroidobacter sp.]|uniref:serine hydrolase domain-containing protein n=1 Tax=Steroidobacter sp. TaxID=1978227 RepID=UPI002EDA6F05
MKTTRSSKTPLLVAAGLLVWSAIASSATGSGAATPDQHAAADAQAVGEFLDRHVPEALREGSVPGASVAVVDANGVLAVRGYGLSDREAGSPVKPDETLFRIGSVTKLITTLVALSLVEEGVLDLHTDINRYLKTIRIPETYPAPVTLQHILTHTGGFGETSSFLHFASDEQTAMTSREMQRMIRRVRAPGLLRSYDNTAFGILGILIADVTGKSFRDVARERVFAPLGMNHSTIGLGEGWLASASQGYGISLSDPLERPALPQAHLGRLVEAAGAGSSTAADMAKLMRALMNGTQYEGGRILSEPLYRAMMDVSAHRAHPRVPGLGYTIYETDYAGRSAIGHGGLIDGFATELAIFPDAQLGVFISSNVGPQAPPLTLSLILEELKVTPEVLAGAGKAMSVSRGTVEKFAETFVAPRRSSDTVEELARLNPADIAGRYASGGASGGLTLGTRLFLGGLGGLNVAMHSPDSLLINGQIYRQVSPAYFVNEENQRSYAFRIENDRVLQVGNPIGWYARAPFYTSGMFTLAPMALGVVLLLTSVVYLAPIGPHTDRASLRILGATLLAATIVFIGAMALELEYAEFAVYGPGNLAWAVLWRLALNGAVVLLMIAPVLVWRALAKQGRPRAAVDWVRSAHLVLLALCAVCVAAGATYWGVLGNLTQ